MELTLALFLRWLDERELLLARLELSLEAPRDPARRRGPDRLARPAGRAWSTAMLSPAARARRGDARAEALVASFDGILLAALLKPARADAGPSCPARSRWSCTRSTRPDGRDGAHDPADAVRRT